MGLDWNPLGRSRAGHEEEFTRLFAELDGGTVSDDDPRLERFREISEAPFETLGAPRVGSDPAADEWLRANLREGADFDEAKSAMSGYYVLDLLPESDGFPVYSNYPMYEGIDRYSFRAKFLDDVADLLGDELMERAYTRMLAHELRAYGDALFDKAAAYARAHGVEHVERERDIEDELGTPARRAHILYSAAKWCRYWAERNHGLDPWF
jgi:hypothetical protein